MEPSSSSRRSRRGSIAFAGSPTRARRLSTTPDPSPLPSRAESRLDPVWGLKLANEGTARVYWHDDDVASIGIRPYVVYGPGRDQGSHRGRRSRWRRRRAATAHDRLRRHRAVRLRARRRSRVRARRTSRNGRRPRRELPGEPSTMQEVVDAIEAAAPEVAGKVHWEEGQPCFRSRCRPTCSSASSARCRVRRSPTASARRSSTSDR